MYRSLFINNCLRPSKNHPSLHARRHSVILHLSLGWIPAFSQWALLPLEPFLLTMQEFPRRCMPACVFEVPKQWFSSCWALLMRQSETRTVSKLACCSLIPSLRSPAPALTAFQSCLAQALWTETATCHHWRHQPPPSWPLLHALHLSEVDFALVHK